jgi:hypothetical protein
MFALLLLWSPIRVEVIPNHDILQLLSAVVTELWLIGFALEVLCADILPHDNVFGRGVGVEAANRAFIARERGLEALYTSL